MNTVDDSWSNEDASPIEDLKEFLQRDPYNDEPRWSPRAMLEFIMKL